MSAPRKSARKAAHNELLESNRKKSTSPLPLGVTAAAAGSPASSGDRTSERARKRRELFPDASTPQRVSTRRSPPPGKTASPPKTPPGNSPTRRNAQTVAAKSPSAHANSTTAQTPDATAKGLPSPGPSPMSKKPPVDTLPQLRRRLRHCLSTPNIRRWCMYEWFYATIDAPFFAHNEFQDFLNGFGLGQVTRLTRTEWSYVRTAMGKLYDAKVRRFSPAFLREERRKLKLQRNVIRSLNQQPQVVPADAGMYLPHGIPPQLVEDQHVTAWHHKSKTFQTGIVTTVGDCAYTVKFDKESLGEMTVPDTMVMGHGIPDSKKRKYEGGGEEAEIKRTKAEGMAASIAASANVDVKELSVLLRLLDQKELIVGEIAEMNNLAERWVAAKRDTVVQYPPEFKKQFAWLVAQLEETNNALGPVLSAILSPKSEGPRTPLRRMGASSNMVKEIGDVCRNAATTLVKSSKPALLTPHTEDSQASEALAVNSLVTGCVSLLHVLHTCSERDVTRAHLYALEVAVHKLKPKHQENISIHHEIMAKVKALKSALGMDDNGLEPSAVTNGEATG